MGYDMDYKVRRSTSFLIFVVASFLVLIRIPGIIIEPRFWVDTMTRYFSSAYNDGIISLIYVHQGYYYLTANLFSWLATLVDLKYAPAVTTFSSFLIQVIPIYLIAFGKSVYFDSITKKIIAVIILVSAVSTPEVHVNAVTTQFHFIVISFLIFLDGFESNRNLKQILVIVSGLSGVLSNVLAPFFLFKYIRERDRDFLIAFFLFMCTSFIQVCAILHSGESNRSAELSVDTLKMIFLAYLQYPLLVNLKSNSVFFVVSLSYAVLLIFNIRKDIDLIVVYFLSFTVLFISIVFSIKAAGGPRYLYAPTLINVFGMFMIASRINTSQSSKILFSLFLVTFILISNFKFYYYLDRYHDKAWLSWSSQVELFKAGKVDKLPYYPNRYIYVKDDKFIPPFPSK